MDNSMRLYNKAVKLYNEGFINKALDYCEKSISDNIKNTSAINLKGLLYYFKGELESAEALWKMNFQVNKDLMSKKYLEDSKNDKNKKLIYSTAIIDIKEFKLKEALNLLQRCKESDYNNINVNNSMAICYIKLGDYNSAIKHIEEVFKIDKKNATAINNNKELISIGVVKRKFKVVYLTIPIVCITLFVIISFAVKNIKKPLAIINNNKLESVKIPPVSVNQEVNDKKDVTQNAANASEKAFSSEELNRIMGEKDYEKLYSLVNEWKDKELNINDKASLENGIELLQGGGIEYLYGKGREALKINDYKTSEKYFTMAFNYGKEYYLYQDILYMLGYSYKRDGQIDNCLRFYKEYDNKFPTGTYEETILYDMSLIYKPIDINLSKDYASRLVKQYSNSIYNNSIIKGILTS
jgi:tetratricopeptide (TPR) repeat protein